MYKCKECGAQYEEKPDYCNCGNDEFDLVQEQKEIANTKSVDNIKPEDNANKVKKVAPQPAQPKTKSFTPPPQNRTYEEQYPVLNRFINSIEPISTAVFIMCILLSLYVIFFAWNPSTVDEKQEVKSEQNKTITSIPPIDKFWNNEAPVVKQEEPKKTEPVENIIKQIIPVQTQKKIEPQKIVKTQQNTTTVSKNKTTPTTKSKTTTTATSTAKIQTNTNAQIQAQKAAEEAARKKAAQERAAAEAAQLKKLQQEQAKKAAEQKAKQTELAKQEFINYKAQLRNTIGRKIDFTKVIGDGSCTVAFKIDSNGKLTNRSFAKQSSNNTLNDAVYNAVMATPNFTPPPSGYNNEILNLNIKFYNGNFEISLP